MLNIERLSYNDALSTSWQK